LDQHGKYDFAIIYFMSQGTGNVGHSDLVMIGATQLSKENILYFFVFYFLFEKCMEETNTMIK